MKILVVVKWMSFKKSGKLHDSGKFGIEAPAIVLEGVCQGVYVPGLIDVIGNREEYSRFLQQGMDVLVDCGGQGYPVLLRGEKND